MEWVLKTNRSTQASRLSLSTACYGCPIASICSLGRPFAKPRLDFYPFTGDGFGWLADDEDNLAVNSVCRNHSDFSCQEGEEASILSDNRIPSDGGDQRIAEHQRTTAESTTSEFNDQRITELSEARSRAAHSENHAKACIHTLKDLRSRLLAMETVSVRTKESGALLASLADATVVPVSSKQLTPAQLQELQALIDEYQDQISWSSNDIGCLADKYKDFYMTIPTEPGARCKQKPYRLSLRELDAFRQQLGILLPVGVVKKASEPTDFLSPVLFVPKPRQPEALRMCMDFRRLNSVTKRDYHSLPFIRDLQQSMKGCKYFTALDLTWGFWALPIVEEDQHKTAFTGPDGEVYVWTKAPMGLCNSPAAFQRLMEHVFQGIKGKTVYVDDITAFSKTWEEHLATLREIFERLKDSGLKVNL